MKIYKVTQIKNIRLKFSAEDVIEKWNLNSTKTNKNSKKIKYDNDFLNVSHENDKKENSIISNTKNELRNKLNTEEDEHYIEEEEMLYKLNKKQFINKAIIRSEINFEKEGFQNKNDIEINEKNIKDSFDQNDNTQKNTYDSVFQSNININEFNSKIKYTKKRKNSIYNEKYLESESYYNFNKKEFCKQQIRSFNYLHSYSKLSYKQQKVKDEALNPLNIEIDEDDENKKQTLLTFYFNKILYGANTFFTLSTISILCTIIYYELDQRLDSHKYSISNSESIIAILIEKNQEYLISDFKEFIQIHYENENFEETFAWIFLVLNSVITLLILFLLFLHYKNILILDNLNGKNPINATFTNSNGFYTYVFLNFLLLIQPWPFLNNIDFQISFQNETRRLKFNYFTLIIFLPVRLYFIISSFISESYYCSERVQRICKMYNTNNSSKLAIKFLIKKHPFRILLILLLINIFMFGYLIKIAERLISYVPGIKFDYYLNCLWYAFITMSTVGYGDLSPETTFGRLIGIIISLNGIFINSLLTVIINDVFTFEGGELKSYNMIKNVVLRKKIHSSSKKLISYLSVFSFLKKKLLKCKHNLKERKILLKKINKLEILKDSELQIFNSLNEQFFNSIDTDQVIMLNDRINCIKILLQGFFNDLNEKIKKGNLII